jgi:hypothetical protein
MVPRVATAATAMAVLAALAALPQVLVDQVATEA